MTQPSDSSLGIRTVEWMRDNGARGLVNTVENFYYSLNAPAKGGPPLRVAAQAVGRPRHRRPRVRPHVADRESTTTGRRGSRPSSTRPCPGEGVWHATFAGGGSRPPVLITSYRPDPAYPRIVAGVAWIDHTRTSVMLYPGRHEPAVPMPSRGPMEVPLGMRGRLVATFNSGFKLSDSGGGFAYDGHTYATDARRHGDARPLPRRPVDIVDWSGGPTVAPRHPLRAAEPAADRRPAAAQSRTCPAAPSGARPSATRYSSGGRRSASTATAT